MNLFRLAVNRPVATSMFFVAVIVFGIYSFLELPVDLFPEIDAPTMSVVTTYNGAGALDVERNVTEHLESTLGTVPDLEEISSTSQDDLSVVTLEFDWSTDIDEATNDVRDRLARIAQILPDDADEPMVLKFDASAIPVIVYSATATESYPELETLIDDRLAGPINRISGVGDVSITGIPERQIHVDLKPDRLEAYGLDIQSLTQVLQAENISSAAGRIDLGDDSFNMRVNAEFKTLEELEALIVANRGGRTIHLADVAQVSEGFSDDVAISRVDGRQGVTFAVQKQSDANTVEVASEVRERMPQLVASLPNDVEVETIIDTSDFIVSSVDNLTSVLFFAIVFVVLVVLFFLRQWRATVVVAATIPVSLVLAFIYLALSGSTLNLISLSSLSIALGMVVDDAIVVLENIMRHLEEGSTPWEAAIYGTQEVGIAVFATTLTVVAVFLPLTFLDGSMGIWFGQLGMIVVVTVVTSTVAAVTLTPMMSSLVLKTVDPEQKSNRLTQALATSIERGLQAMDRFYAATLRRALGMRKTVVFFSFVIFAAGLAMIPRIGTEFMPVSDDSRITISGELATSRSLEFTSQVVRRLEGQITDSVPELKMLNTTSGQSGGMMGASGGANEFQIRLELVDLDQRDRSVFEMTDELRILLGEVPEVVDYSVTAGSGGGGGGGQPVAVQIVGHDLDETSALAQSLADHMETIEGLRDITISRGASRPEFEYIVDRRRLSEFGLNAAAVANVIRGNIAGQTATIYRRDGEEYDVVLRFAERDRRTLAQLEAMRMTTPTGQRIRIDDVVELREIGVPPSIEHLDRERSLTVSAGLQDRGLNYVIEDIDAWIADQNLSPQIEIVYGGDIEEQQEAFMDLFMLLMLSLLLVYLVMAAQFESLKEPFIIMFSIPFAFTGVLLALLVTDTALSVIAMVGSIILVGIVVKNAIVLLDFVKLLQGRDRPVIEAIVEGGVSRLRPVLMTTLTTILAMVPLALSLGEGAETWQPMAIAVIGGLAFSTLVTLVLVPVIYGMFEYKTIRRQTAALSDDRELTQP